MSLNSEGNEFQSLAAAYLNVYLYVYLFYALGKLGNNKFPISVFLVSYTANNALVASC